MMWLSDLNKLIFRFKSYTTVLNSFLIALCVFSASKSQPSPLPAMCNSSCLRGCNEYCSFEGTHHVFAHMPQVDVQSP